MSNLKLYTEFIANWISNGNLINRDKISSTGIRGLYDRVLTKKYIRKMWVVTHIPPSFRVILLSELRYTMYRLHPDAKIIIHTMNEPVRVATESNSFRRQKAMASKQFEQYKSVYDQLSQDQQSSGVSLRVGNGQRISITPQQLIRMAERYESYEYVFQHQNESGKFFHTRYFIECLTTTNKEMREVRKTLHEELMNLGVGFKEIKINIGAILENVGVAGYKKSDKLLKRVPKLLMSDENLSRQMWYKARGVVGEGTVLMGLDYRSREPFCLNFFGASTGQVNLLLGKTGSGKSYAGFQLALSLISNDVHCSVIDIKGEEWDALLGLVKGITISMDSDNPRFVNTMRLDDLDVDYSNCEEFYNSAVNGTKTLLSIMCGLADDHEDAKDLDTILDNAIVKTLSLRGVDSSEPHTFKNTKGIKYSEILTQLELSIRSTAYTPKQKELCQTAKNRCEVYLSDDSRYGLFKNEITLQEVLDQPFVIYSFNKNKTALLDTLDTIKVFMVQFLDSKKQSIRKRQHKHSASFYEELSRCDQFGKLLVYIQHVVTGSRSNNVTVFLLLNALTTFDNKDAKPILSNITTVIAGKLSSQDIDLLTTRYDCESIRHDLLNINKEPRYDHCFACKYDVGGGQADNTIYKVELPKALEERFRTRDLKV